MMRREESHAAVVMLSAARLALANRTRGFLGAGRAVTCLEKAQKEPERGREVTCSKRTLTGAPFWRVTVSSGSCPPSQRGARAGASAGDEWRSGVRVMLLADQPCLLGGG